MNVRVLVLFIMPMITMRTYAEEKRSGTIELLLTSPLTDLQIILGKFIGAMLLYSAMLAVTLIHVGLLFLYGNPEWKPIATGYLGLLLMGGCFLSVGLLISSLTKNQIVAGMVTFSMFLLLWVINWVSSFVGPTAPTVLNYGPITEHFANFPQGHTAPHHIGGVRVDHSPLEGLADGRADGRREGIPRAHHRRPEARVQDDADVRVQLGQPGLVRGRLGRWFDMQLACRNERRGERPPDGAHGGHRYLKSVPCHFFRSRP